MRGKLGLAFVVGFGLGLVMGAPHPSSAQGVVSQAPNPVSNQERLSRQMTEALRNLARQIAAVEARIPGGRLLLQDVQELEQATEGWYALLKAPNNPYQARRSYAAIDAAPRLAAAFRDVDVERLYGKLSQVSRSRVVPDLPSVRDVARTSEQIHRALGMPGYPTVFNPYDNDL